MPDRSIPARTGEPSVSQTHPPPTPVYPRTYGGTADSERWPRPTLGLSPHVRGNLVSRPAGARRDGSIPARTGEPVSSSTAGNIWRVYPRTYGGTHRPTRVVSSKHGLSPHVRGNPYGLSRAARHKGSIPARTGGTPKAMTKGELIDGLSPRVRVNPLDDWLVSATKGSIPARTGEPASGRISESTAGGLSPRVRGNLLGGR